MQGACRLSGFPQETKFSAKTKRIKLETSEYIDYLKKGNKKKEGGDKSLLFDQIKKQNQANIPACY